MPLTTATTMPLGALVSTILARVNQTPDSDLPPCSDFPVAVTLGGCTLFVHAPMRRLDTVMGGYAALPAEHVVSKGNLCNELDCPVAAGMQQVCAGEVLHALNCVEAARVGFKRAMVRINQHIKAARGGLQWLLWVGAYGEEEDQADIETTWDYIQSMLYSAAHTERTKAQRSATYRDLYGWFVQLTSQHGVDLDGMKAQQGELGLLG